MLLSAVAPHVSVRAPLVLLVDDDSDALAIHGHVLRRRGFRVAEAADAERGIEAAIALAPDVILMDSSMPGTSGDDAARRLKADPRTEGIPIVMLTGFSPPAAALGRRDYDAYLTKPCSPELIAATLRSLIADC